MTPSRHPGDVVRFGPFEVDLQQGVLSKHGIRIRLQAQPFQVLAALLEKPGAAVTRDELRRRLWPEDTFVDFEHGLNAAVTRLRQALGDSAEEPRYIETLAKRGYRFSANVEGPPVAIEDEAASGPVPAPKRGAAIWIAAIVLVAAGGSVAFLLFSNRSEPQAGRPVPLTTFRGIEANPALSSDGSHVAFTWNGEKQDNFDIYVMPIPSGAPSRLTTDPADDVSPAWSPDGRTIAFLRRRGGDRGELFLVPATGGPEHKLGEIRDLELAETPGRLVSVAWSPDGAWIAASHREPSDSSEGLYLFSPTGERRKLTSPPGVYGDHMPAFSPDGRALAFCRLQGFSSSEIYLLPLDGKEARRLTTYRRWSVNPVWTSGGHAILHVFSEDTQGRPEMRIIKVPSPQMPSRTVPLGDDAWEISAGRHLVYSRRIEDTNIWRAELPADGKPPGAAELFISSTRGEHIPRYSPDGTTIAFISSRSGSREIWMSKADGSHPVRMTFFGGPLVGVMNWSPDGQRLVFHARPDGQADLFVIAAAGGSAKRLTYDSSDDTMPSHSHDGNWIYFSSARSGQLQIWRMPAAGGEAERITTSGGYQPFESPDGKRIFYYRDVNEIWSVPVDGGPPVKVAGPTHAMPFGFAVTAAGLYYPGPPHSGEQSFIRFLSFATGENRPVAVANRRFHVGMSVSPDSRYLLFDQFDEVGSDLMLVENFRPQ